MHDLKLLLQIIALACFFISWMAWSVPKTRPLYWLAGGFFWLLLSFMLSGFEASVHAAG
jgi:hypothetical protein